MIALRKLLREEKDHPSRLHHILKTPPRVQRILLHIRDYDSHVKYKLKISHDADRLPRELSKKGRNYLVKKVSVNRFENTKSKRSV